MPKRDLGGDFTIDELMVACICRQVVDGEILAQGLATPLVAAGYLLAWRTHAPNVGFASAIGQSLCQDGAPLGLATIESLWLDRALVTYGFVSAAVDMLPWVRPKEFFRPGQVDAAGNFNNIALGMNPRRPRLRLPGSGGIPDVTTVLSDICLYVPRHSRVTFVERVDVKSGLGHDPARRRGSGARYLVSDLGEFDFADGALRLIRIHPGATLDLVRAKSGCRVEVAADVRPTEPPTPEQLRLLREEIDPLGVRRLEFLSGPERRAALGVMVRDEAAASARQA